MTRSSHGGLALATYLLASLGTARAAAPPTPNFLARRDYTGLDSNWMQVGDINGDGIPDLIADFGGYIQTLLGNGDGTFSPGPSTHTAAAALSFVATDLNGDGTADLVLPGTGPLGGAQFGVTISLGNGDGTFQTGTFYPAGTNPNEDLADAVVVDFNNDGNLDVAVTGTSGVWLFTGKGGGTFNPGVLVFAKSQLGGGQIAAADLNGDGDLDLVVALLSGNRMNEGGFVVLFGNGDGTFQAPVAFHEPKNTGALAVGALTKGGHPSIAAAGGAAGGTVYLYFGNGAGNFSAPRTVNLRVPSYEGLAIADVNGDGIPDLVSTGVGIAFGKGDGTFKKAVYYTVEGVNGISNAVVADLRNDGRMDIVTNSTYAISVLLNQGKGKYQDGNWTAVTGGAGCGTAADYNGDGKPDLAVNTSQGITILLGTGKASAPYTVGASIPLANAGCLVTGDLNGDGIPDLLVPVNGTMVAYLGNGDGTFAEKSTTATPSGGYVVLADFNHDGKLDFATSGNLFALGNGDGTFQTPTQLVSSPPANPFVFIATGDLNGDGRPDLALTDTFDNLIYTLLNNQKGGFTQNSTYLGTAYYPAQIVLADLNGDGNADAVVGGNYGGAGVYLSDGKGGLTLQVGLTGLVSLGQNQFAVSDVNSDGIPDILVLSASTVVLYLGQSDATYEPPIGLGVGPAPGFILTENLHGQSQTAGIPDIVTPDLSGGVTVLINKTR